MRMNIGEGGLVKEVPLRLQIEEKLDKGNRNKAAYANRLHIEESTNSEMQKNKRACCYVGLKS
jgi:hypothetical protein